MLLHTHTLWQLSVHLWATTSTLEQSCETTLSDRKRKYTDKVNALLSAWEHVASYIGSPANAAPETTQSLIEWANEHTLELVLRGEWPKLGAATKTHLNGQVQRCAVLLSQQPNQQLSARRCQTLIDLVQNPWAKPALEVILHNGQLNSEHEEEEFCCQERGELLKMRLKILCEERCEDIAVNLAAACVRSLRRSERLSSLSERGHVNYMIDVYIVLLYKHKRTQDIVAQLKSMDLKDGLELMQRLSGERPTKYGTARVWRNSGKAAELVAQYLVTTGMVQSVQDVGHDTLESILSSWARLHARLQRDEDGPAAASHQSNMLSGIVRKLIEPAESAQHIYIFCGVLVRQFGEPMKALVIELYIRALTTDMNELENQKSKANKEKVQETAQRLSREFLRLADYVRDSLGIARECVLTAFSLHPTRECYERIRELAVACGKISRASSVEVTLVKSEVSDESDVQIKVEPTEAKEANKENAISQDETEVTSSDNKTDLVLKQEDTLKKGEFTIAVNNVKPKVEQQSESLTDGKAKCHSQNATHKASDDLSRDVKEVTEIKTEASEKRPNTDKDTTKSTVNRSHQEALILIKGDAVTGSANYDEKAVPDQVLDGEKLGISPQLRDDLSVVLSSQRYHVLTWWLDWKELSELCERYLENAEEMRNTNKELKYLNIDYSQFKDQPYNDVRENQYCGIEKGYEQWDDSDYSESEATHQQSTTTDAKTTAVNRRSPDESSDTDSENIVAQPTKRGRPRKVQRLESSESEYDNRHRKPRQRYKKALILSSESSDTNTQDSQTSSLGSDGFKRSTGRPSKKACNGTKTQVTKRPRKSKTTTDSVSHFHILVNENIRPDDSVNGVSDNNRNDIMTLFSADMDENKRESLKGKAAFEAAQLMSEKRSDPETIKSLRMFRPHGKKLSQINEKSNSTIGNGVVIKKEKISVNENDIHVVKPNKFAPMLSTLNLNPKIALRRVDEVAKKLNSLKKKKQVVTTGDLSNELRNIEKSIPFSPTKSALTGYTKQKALSRRRKSVPNKSLKSGLNKSLDILTKTVPGMRSMEFSVLPRIQSTVNVVQLSRGLSQSSPNSASTTAAGNTPPRGSGSNGNRVGSNAIQLPGTPSSTSGHDSGVGMSPAGQTPPPATRPSSLQDVSEEANPPPDTSPGQDGTRTVALTVLANQRIGSNQSPKKSPSPSGNNATEPKLVIQRADGSYQLLSSSMVAGQRGILAVQNLEDGNLGFTRQVPVATVAGADIKTTTQSQANKNTGLPKFQQAFGKTICALSTESSTVPSSSATDAHESSSTPAGVVTNVQQQRTVVKALTVAAASGLTKAVQTGQNANIVSIPNLQVSPGTRQILNLVQSAVSSSTGTSGASPVTGQALLMPNSTTSGLIYAHKMPGNSGATQLISIPASLSNTRSPVQVKLNIVRAGVPYRPNAAIQAVLASRLQQQSQQSQAQQQTVRPADPLINSTIDIPNQVSSSTLEQLREFESVLEQVKERSTSQSTSADTTTVQTQTQTTQNSPKSQPQSQQVPVNTLTQQLLMQSTQSTGNAVEFNSNGNAITFQQQEVYPQKVALMYTNQNSGSAAATPKAANSSTPVVVVTSYCQPAASPALSVTSQSSSSPCVTPAPAPVSSTGKAQPQSSSKSAKKAAPKTVKVNTQAAAKAAPIPKPQQKPQEDPETQQRIYAILGQYAEQLRNSPDLNNKPAPRRRSNPPTNPNQSSKRKKSSSGKSKPASGQQTSEPSPSADDAGRTMGSSEDSSGGMGGMSSGSANGTGLMHVQDSPSAGFSASEETLAGSNNNSQSGTNDNPTLTNITDGRTSTTSDSNDGADVNVKRRNLIFSEPNTASGQARAVIVQEAAVQSSSVGEALASVTGKMTTGTAVLVSEASMKPEPSSPATVMTTVSTPTTTTTSSTSLEAATQFLVSGGPSSSDSQESASSTIPTSTLESSSMDDGTKVENGVLCGSNARLQEAWEPCEERKTGGSSPDTTPWRFVPAASCNSLNEQQLKTFATAQEAEATGSTEANTTHTGVLQIISKGQGIELSTTGGVFQTKKYYQHNPTMNNSIAESFQPAKFAVKGLGAAKSTGPTAVGARTVTAAEQEHQRKQQILECELRLQKSLSEECEDLGVDEPSTSDLFPEADLQLFDANHSPSFDHSSQEASCSQTLSGMKSYNNPGSFFKTLDPVTSTAGGRDASPVVPATSTTSSAEPKKKTPQQRRTPKAKETTARRNKRSMDHGLQVVDGTSSAKQLRLSLADSLSQEEASNSNSDLSRLSPAIENELVKETSVNQKLESNGSNDRDDAPTSSRPMEVNTTSGSAEIARRAVGCNNAISSTAVSSGDEDESLTLLEGSAANVTIPSPLSPISGPLLMTHRYTYSNSKKRAVPVKQPRPNEFFSDPKTSSLSWDSPTSGRTRSSSDEEMNDEENEADESSMSESFAPTPVFDSTENSTMGNGLETSTQRNASKAPPVDHATYSAKKKTPVARRTTMNHRDINTGSGLNKSTDAKSGSVITANSTNKKTKTAPAISTLTPVTTTTSENESLSPVPMADKLYDINPSDDEALASVMTPASSVGSGAIDATNTGEHCSTARRSSLRGHVKKGCGCCNGSPERPKPKKVVTPKQQNTQQPHQQHQSQLQTDGPAAVAGKVKKVAAKQQQSKQLAKKR